MSIMHSKVLKLFGLLKELIKYTFNQRKMSTHRSDWGGILVNTELSDFNPIIISI